MSINAAVAAGAAFETEYQPASPVEEQDPEESSVLELTRIYVGADSGEIWSTEYRKAVLTEEHLSDGIDGIDLSDYTTLSVGDTIWIVGEDWTTAGLVHIDVTQQELDEMDAPRKLDGYDEHAVLVRGGGDENFADLGRFMDNTDLAAEPDELESTRLFSG